MLIAVAGATGVVGRHVVDVASERGHGHVALARAAGVDLMSGDALAERLAGVDAVVDVTSVMTQRQDEAEAFFGTVTRTLVSAEQRCGVGHHVALSIVGIDDVASGYYLGKRLQERLLAQGTQPWSVLRATQFHEFAEQALHFARFGPFSLVPVMASQPIAAREVAEALVDLVEAGPSGRVPDLAGPEPHVVHRLSRRLSKAHGLGRWVIPVRLPGAVGRAMASGALRPASDGPRGAITFEQWLTP